MSEEGETTLEVKGLDKLIKAMGVEPPSVKVGVLGQKGARTQTEGGEGGQLSNAEIGAFHEFGLGNNPVRSFLRQPISDNLENAMEKSGALDKDVLKDTMASGDLVPYMKKIAVLAEGIVAEAFDTGGFGKWEPSDMSGKKNAQTLVETQQLRNSITSEVKEGSG